MALLVAGPVLLGLFVSHVLRIDHPVIDVRMFSTVTFSLSLGIVCLFTMLQYGRLVFIPIELQTLRGVHPAPRRHPVRGHRRRHRPRPCPSAGAWPIGSEPASRC